MDPVELFKELLKLGPVAGLLFWLFQQERKERKLAENARIGYLENHGTAMQEFAVESRTTIIKNTEQVEHLQAEVKALKASLDKALQGDR